ncbi:hypothetical protein ECANGB1_1568 [Enterospora canceri]|uniref:Uncharacterized protein n=1 Tax=Enterospora canceri TaxID=1081671 RepID=A0A1Y1S6Y0_9MICR|nr:hypothetical protein ECANGB1_1568 [Enterospora canceri]
MKYSLYWATTSNSSSRFILKSFSVIPREDRVLITKLIVFSFSVAISLYLSCNAVLDRGVPLKPLSLNIITFVLVLLRIISPIESFNRLSLSILSVSSVI